MRSSSSELRALSSGSRSHRRRHCRYYSSPLLFGFRFGWVVSYYCWLQLLTTAFLLLLPLSFHVSAQTIVEEELPGGFQIQPVLSRLMYRPTDFDFVGTENRIVTVSKEGLLDLFEFGTEDADDEAQKVSTALDLTGVICFEKERGLQSVLAHPNYGASYPYIYIFYSRQGTGGSTCNGPDEDHVPHPDAPVSRVSRFTLEPGATQIDIDSEWVLLETGPNGETHHGGHMAMGADGYLYITTGDVGYDQAADLIVAERLDNLHGKVLRIGLDGKIPPTNPYVFHPGSISCRLDRRVPEVDSDVVCQEIFSVGFRNPYNIAIDPTTSDENRVRFYVGDVGAATWEEINIGGYGYEKSHYGWSYREGPCLRNRADAEDCTPSEEEDGRSFIDPVHWWRIPPDAGSAVVGGAVVPDNAGWPESYHGGFLFMDVKQQDIYFMKPSSGGGCRGVGCTEQVSEYASVPIVQGIPKEPLRLYFRPYQGVPTLYVLIFGKKGSLFRIVAPEDATVTVPPPTTNQPPEAVIDVLYYAQTTATTALTVRLDGSNSSDPDGDDLLYVWDLDDDSTEDDSTVGMLVTHTYTTAGAYTVKLIVYDRKGGSDRAEMTIHVQDAQQQESLLDFNSPNSWFPWTASGQEGCSSDYDYCGTLEFCKGGSWTYGFRLPCSEECLPAQGPVIRMEPGNKYRFTLRNAADDKSNIHPHGLHIVGAGDGDDVTRLASGGGNCLDYTWDISPDHPGGTYWYHPHPHGISEEQVTGGAFGMLIIEDNRNLNDDIPEWASNELLLQIAHIEGVLSANGKFYNVMDVDANQWYRLRVSIVDPLGKPLNLTFTEGCEVHRVASDGVWHSTVPGPSADRFELTGASRADFAMRCTVPGSTVNILFHSMVAAIVNVGSDESNPYGMSQWNPNRPLSLQGIESASVPEENRFSISIQRETLNDLPWDPDVPLRTIAFGEVHEWEIGNSQAHPFHLHLYHMLIVTPGGCGAHEEGEFYDTISGPPCTVRFRAADIGQRCVFHCHVMLHSDLGAVGWVDVQGPNMPLNNDNQAAYTCPAATQCAVPAATPSASPVTPAPVTSPTTGPTLTPVAAPTAGPTLTPVTSPTTAGPTATPVAAPTAGPTLMPVSSPTTAPTLSPAAAPSAKPTSLPPVAAPTAKPITLIATETDDPVKENGAATTNGDDATTFRSTGVRVLTFLNAISVSILLFAACSIWLA